MELKNPDDAPVISTFYCTGDESAIQASCTADGGLYCLEFDYMLPQSGGGGSLPFTAGGAVLALTAVLMLNRQRRKEI